MNLLTQSLPLDILKFPYSYNGKHKICFGPERRAIPRYGRTEIVHVGGAHKCGNFSHSVATIHHPDSFQVRPSHHKSGFL